MNIRDLDKEIMGKIGSGNSFKNENVINWKNWLNEYKFLPGHPTSLMPGFLSFWPEKLNKNKKMSFFSLPRSQKSTLFQKSTFSLYPNSML